MRLLLDEMYPPVIAEQLRTRGHDVQAVAARAELRSLPDAEIFSAAQSEQRALATENISDFSYIADDFDARDRTHHGVIFVSPMSYPRGDPRTIGRMVTALNGLLSSNPSDEPTSLRQWL